MLVEKRERRIIYKICSFSLRLFLGIKRTYIYKLRLSDVLQEMSTKSVCFHTIQVNIKYFCPLSNVFHRLKLYTVKLNCTETRLFIPIVSIAFKLSYLYFDSSTLKVVLKWLMKWIFRYLSPSENTINKTKIQSPNSAQRTAIIRAIRIIQIRI